MSATATVNKPFSVNRCHYFTQNLCPGIPCLQQLSTQRNYIGGQRFTQSGHLSRRLDISKNKIRHNDEISLLSRPLISSTKSCNPSGLCNQPIDEIRFGLFRSASEAAQNLNMNFVFGRPRLLVPQKFSVSRRLFTRMNGTTWSVEKAIPEELKVQIRRAKDEQDTTLAFLSFLNILRSLKTTKRTGWLNFNVENPESIADHMYRMGVISMMTQNVQVESAKCVKMALVHDMAEALVGDITPEDPVTKEDKHAREAATIEYIRDLLEPFNSKASQELYTLWHEYENLSSPEARFVKDVDKFELLVQTLEEERRYKGEKDLSRFIGVRKQIQTPEVCKWADMVLAQRDEFWKSVTKPN